MKKAKAKQDRARDGVWTNCGLYSDFKLIRGHPYRKDLHFVQTAAGERWAYSKDLVWDARKKAK